METFILIPPPPPRPILSQEKPRGWYTDHKQQKDPNKSCISSIAWWLKSINAHTHVQCWHVGGSISISMRWTRIPSCSCSLETLCCSLPLSVCALSSCHIHPPVISRKSSCVVSPCQIHPPTLTHRAEVIGSLCP